MLLQMLTSRKWMTDTDVATTLHCQPDQAFDRVRKIARKHKLCAMCIVDEEERQRIIAIKRSTKATIVKFVSILPP
jgi:hypothetical protein